MDIFQVAILVWMRDRFQIAVGVGDRAHEALTFETLLYIPQAEYDVGVTGGYIDRERKPTQKFKEEFSPAVTGFCLLK